MSRTNVANRCVQADSCDLRVQSVLEGQKLSESRSHSSFRMPCCSVTLLESTTVNFDPMRCENRTQKQQRRLFQHSNVESTTAESPNTEVDASESTSVLDTETERTAQHRREVSRSACRWIEAWWTCLEVNVEALGAHCDENTTSEC